MCPDCGSDQIDIVEFDFGICPQTGYHDCGELFRCLECGAAGELGELLDSERGVVHRAGEAEPSDTKRRTN